MQIVLYKTGTKVVYGLTSAGEPMLLQLCNVVQEHFSNLNKSPQVVASDLDCVKRNDEAFFSLTEIDHMRDRKSYLKILTQWAGELSISGRIIFCSRTRRIFMILTTVDEGALKEFHVRHRTNVVDVDSNGRPCKERQMTFLCPPTIIQHRTNIFEDFCSIEIPNETAKDLAAFFNNHQLADIFNAYVK